MNMRTMRQSFVWALLIPGIILTFIMASTMVFGFLYASTGSSTFQSLLYIVDLALVFIYVTVGIIEVRTLHRLYQEGLYEISRRNLGHLRHGDGTLERYPEENIAELKDLNRALEDVEQKWKYSILYSVEADYSQLGIEWVDESKHLVPAGFLKERLQSLVHVYGVFYVGLLELYYEIGKEKLDEEEKQRLLALADDRFRFVKGRLFAFTEDEKGMLCFLPGLDSIRIVQEKVVSMADDSAISKRGSSGLGLFPLKGALVCYPYSSVSDMLEDLRYAKRQTAPITVFLPDRKKAKSNPLGLAEHSDAKAFFKSVNHALRRLSDESLGKDKTNLQTVYEAVASFLGTDFNELILHDQLNGTYYPYFHDLGDHIEAKVLQPLFDSLDFNDSVYFSCRESCPAAIAREVDLYGVTSGFIFALRNGKDYLGVAYFEKRGGELVVDSYVRDQLVRFGQDLADYFMMAEKETRAKAFQREAEAIMGLSNHMVYRIDENTHQITYFSPNMRSLFHDVAVGEVCHKALYGIDRPCPHCPLLEMAKMKDVRKAKMSGKVREVELETSLTLDAHTARERILLVRPTEGKLSEDPYDRNWLVYSYAALLSQLENAYRIHSRGYLLLLSIDNMAAFLQQWGNEGTSMAIRNFIAAIKETLNMVDVYAYNPSTVAILLPRAGQIELLDDCEAIYDLSKKRYASGVAESYFTLTYLPLGYPQAQASAQDFLSHVEDFYQSREYKRGEDTIFFEERALSRSASKHTHMVHVIDEVFGAKNANCFSLQPMLIAENKKLFGAEVLLRVEDKQRHNLFRADQLSQVAEENGRIGLITESLLNFVHDLYEEHGSSLFALNAFRRIAINVDAAILKEADLAQKVASLYQEHHLAKDFLAFEVPESLITDSFSAEGNAVVASGALLVCDQYTGRYVSLEKLKTYGFKEIKLPRGLIDGIDVDPKKYESLASIVHQAKSLGLKVSAVGVETSEQYMALRDLDPEMLLQGYHFYKPLSRSDLIAAVISHNR